MIIDYGYPHCKDLSLKVNISNSYSDTSTRLSNSNKF